MCKIDPKDKHIHKAKHNHIQTHMYNMFVQCNYFMELGVEGKTKEKASIIS
jgi:hypothetical protein